MARHCPTSGKRQLSKSDAQRQMRELARDPRNGHLNVYRCTCGRWHVGHIRGTAPARHPSIAVRPLDDGAKR